MSVLFTAFATELIKLSGQGAWKRFVNLFGEEGDKTRRRVEYHFSPKAGNDRWDKLLKNVRSQDFVDMLASHPDADKRLKAHAQSLHDLSRGPVIGKIRSEVLPGRSYEVRELPNGELGCTCNDWRFRGTLEPGYICKHIKALYSGQVQAG